MKKTTLFLSIIVLIVCSACNTVREYVLFDNLELKGSDAKVIYNEKTFKDFELSMEVCTTSGGKGEIWFHSDSELNTGYNIAINNDKMDSIWWKMTGSLIGIRNLTKTQTKDNQWFTVKISVEGKSIQIFIDDKIVVDYIEPVSPYRIESQKNQLLSEGFFGFTGDGAGDILFKNIKVKKFKSATAKLIADQQAEAINEQEDVIIKLHQSDFPVLDYHVHLKGGLIKEEAVKQSRKTGINYVIAPNCGIGFPITNDEQIFAYLDTMRIQPFILAMQAEGREWITTFSEKARNEFDFVFTDALTFTDSKGRRTRLWIPEETWIENEEKYMDEIVDKICSVLKEPVDVYVNPCFLPAQMNDRYDAFWTEARMNKFIKALAESGKALEINELYNIPNKAIIMKAKEAGIKFTFGTNNVTPEVSKLEYGIRMKNECNITAKDMYKPKVKI